MWSARHSGQWSARRCHCQWSQLTALDSRCSVRCDQLAVTGSQWSAHSGRLAVESRRLTVTGSQSSACTLQSSARIDGLAVCSGGWLAVVGSHCWPTGERAWRHARPPSIERVGRPGSSLGVDVHARRCHARAECSGLPARTSNRACLAWESRATMSSVSRAGPARLVCSYEWMHGAWSILSLV